MTATIDAPAVGTKTLNTTYPSHVVAVYGSTMKVGMDKPWGNYPTSTYKYVEGRGWCEAFYGTNDWVVLRTAKALQFAS